MALTDLQKSRIAFHLDYFNPNYMLQITRDSLLLTLDPTQELQLVGLGNFTDPTQDIYIEEEFVCSKTSILGRVELAFNNLNSEVIEDSLYVSQAGQVTLRGNELRKRTELYEKMVSFLSQFVGGTDPNGWGRVGHG